MWEFQFFLCTVKFIGMEWNELVTKYPRTYEITLNGFATETLIFADCLFVSFSFSHMSVWVASYIQKLWNAYTNTSWWLFFYLTVIPLNFIFLICEKRSWQFHLVFICCVRLHVLSFRHNTHFKFQFMNANAVKLDFSKTIFGNH